MRRDQLEHAIRTSCQIIDATAVVVTGSQAILGTYREEDLPAQATMSMEVDILPSVDDNDEAIRLGDLIEGVAGEFSQFEETHGFSIDGVDHSTSALPEGWRDRLVHTSDYFAWALEHSRPGNLIVADNVVRDGTLADEGSDDPVVQAQRRLHEMLGAEPRLSATTIQTVGAKGYDGFTIVLVNE